MSQRVAILLLGLSIAAAGCGSGGSGGGDKSPLTAGFSADQPNPGNETVAMAEGASAGDLVTIDVNVTGTNDVYGISFDVTFDDSDVVYDGWSKGSLLEQSGHAVSYQVVSQAGKLVVSASRQGSVSGANAAGTVPIIRLAFRAVEAGGHTISFENPELLDSQVQPQPISVDWFGGALTAS